MTSLPLPILEQLQETLTELGDPGPVLANQPVGGGCINHAQQVITAQRRYFLKWNERPLPGMFPAEALGLQLLHGTHTIQVPQPLASADADGDRPGFILTDWIDTPASTRSVDMELLGHQLAALHASPGPDQYGLASDNYIGSTPQTNAWHEDWVEFFRQQRLMPQVRLAERNGFWNRQRGRQAGKVMDSLERWLGGVSRKPSLIHGDLWGGNVIAAAGGRPVLIDPAVNYADREAEIAFTELFGGFSARFYAAYQEAFPFEPGYQERRDLYNLYHLLNHLNLFGEGYGHQVDAVLRRYSA